MKTSYLLALVSITLFSCSSSEDNLTQQIEATIKTGDTDQIQMLQKEIESKIQTLSNISQKLSDELLELGIGAHASEFVGVEPVKKRDFTNQIEVSGEVETDHNILLSAELSGVLKKIFVQEGQQVTKGAVLAVIDDGGILSQLSSLRAQLNLAQTIYERQKRLWHQKIGSEVEYLQAKSQKESLEGNVKQMEDQLNKTIVRAPFSGYVDDILPKKGEFMTPGTPILRLINTSSLYVTAYVSENFAGKIQHGAEVSLLVSNLDEQIKGRVAQVSKNIETNRNFKVKIAIDSKLTKELSPNQMVRAFITTEKITGVIVLKKEFINRHGEVFVLENVHNGEGTVVKKGITTTISSNTEAIVDSGLSEGELIINTGNKSLKDGQVVKLAE